MNTFWKAITNNDTEEVKRQLTVIGEDVNEVDGTTGNSALHLASKLGLFDIAVILIAQGAKVDARNATLGWTPLHFAAYEGHAKIVRFLIESGADPMAKDLKGETPETRALEWENTKCAMILRETLRSMKDSRRPDGSGSKRRGSLKTQEKEMNLGRFDKKNPSSRRQSSAFTQQEKPLQETNITTKKVEEALKLASDIQIIPRKESIIEAIPPFQILQLGKVIPIITNQTSKPVSVDEHDADSDDESKSRKSSSGSSASSNSFDTEAKGKSKTDKKQLEANQKPPGKSGGFIEELRNLTALHLRNLRANSPLTEPRKQNQVKNPAAGEHQERKPDKKLKKDKAMRKSPSKIGQTEPEKPLNFVPTSCAEESDSNSSGDVLETKGNQEDELVSGESESTLIQKLDAVLAEEALKLEKELTSRRLDLDKVMEKHREEETAASAVINALESRLQSIEMKRQNYRESPTSRRLSLKLEKNLECVCCRHVCLPPEKIFQCENGDLICEQCKDNPNVAVCPECSHELLSASLARNKALEKLALQYYQQAKDILLEAQA